MPTACLTDVRVCNTHAPGWLNGQHPTTDEGEVTRQVCCHWLSNCYKWSNNIKVKNQLFEGTIPVPKKTYQSNYCGDNLFR